MLSCIWPNKGRQQGKACQKWMFLLNGIIWYLQHDPVWGRLGAPSDSKHQDKMAEEGRRRKRTYGQENWPEHSAFVAERRIESSPTHSQPRMARQMKKWNSSICWKCCCFCDMQKDIFFDIVPSFTLLRAQPAIYCDFSQTFSGQIFHFLLTPLMIVSIQAECVCLILQKCARFTRASPSITPSPPLPTTPVYHLLDALHIVWFVSVGVTVNIKNRVWKENT